MIKQAHARTFAQIPQLSFLRIPSTTIVILIAKLDM